MLNLLELDYPKWFDNRKGIQSVKLKLAKSTSMTEGPHLDPVQGKRDIKVEEDIEAKMINTKTSTLGHT